MWRRIFAQRYRRLCDEAHRSGLLVVFHSCGNVFEIMGDLIDAGIDVIDPLQPEAMDLAVVAREYGGSVGFCGGISDQRLGTQTPSQVRDQIRWLIDTLGAPFGNAYVLAPSNSLMPEIPRRTSKRSSRPATTSSRCGPDRSLLAAGQARTASSHFTAHRVAVAARAYPVRPRGTRVC